MNTLENITASWWYQQGKTWGSQFDAATRNQMADQFIDLADTQPWMTAEQSQRSMDCFVSGVVAGMMGGAK